MANGNKWEFGLHCIYKRLAINIIWSWYIDLGLTLMCFRSLSDLEANKHYLIKATTVKHLNFTVIIRVEHLSNVHFTIQAQPLIKWHNLIWRVIETGSVIIYLPWVFVSKTTTHVNIFHLQHSTEGHSKVITWPGRGKFSRQQLLNIYTLQG